MSDRFLRAFELLSVHEGGYVNHPDDPGGATNRGVTQRTYDGYNRRMGKTQRSVRMITEDEVREIYRRQYWDAIHADELPEGVAYCVFDAAVNSGPARAVKWLQQVIGAGVDGVVGNETIGLSERMVALSLIDAYCDKRLAFMKRLRHWPTFARGWSRRVSEVRAQSKAWAAGAKPHASEASGQPQASGPVRPSATTLDALTEPKAISAATGVLGSVGALASGEGPVPYALAAVLVIVALAGVWLLVRGRGQD